MAPEQKAVAELSALHKKYLSEAVDIATRYNIPLDKLIASLEGINPKDAAKIAALTSMVQKSLPADLLGLITIEQIASMDNVMLNRLGNAYKVLGMALDPNIAKTVNVDLLFAAIASRDNWLDMSMADRLTMLQGANVIYGMNIDGHALKDRTFDAIKHFEGLTDTDLEPALQPAIRAGDSMKAGLAVLGLGTLGALLSFATTSLTTAAMPVAIGILVLGTGEGSNSGASTLYEPAVDI